jgi:CRP-like cAMP-binding protein
MKNLSVAAPTCSEATDHTNLLAFLEDANLRLGAHRRTITKAQRVEISVDAASAVYVVVDGRLRVSTPTLQGIDVFITDVERGELIGESAAFGNNNVPLVVEASETSDTFVIDRANFLRAIEEHGAFSTAVVRAMCRRLCRVNQRLADAVTLPMPTRLKAELMRLARLGADGTLIIDRLPTHEDLALRISSQREAVTKEITKFIRGGLIARNGRGLLIIKDLNTSV